MDSKSVSVEVVAPIELEREGWHASEYGQLWGTYSREIQVRCLVTYYGPNDEPQVEILDKAVVEDAGLTAAELEGVEEKAIDLGYAEFMSTERDDEETLRADYLHEQRRDASLRGVA